MDKSLFFYLANYIKYNVVFLLFFDKFFTRDLDLELKSVLEFEPGLYSHTQERLNPRHF
jgi:hypothetical protein